jgi:hypothetical protein
MIAKRIEKFLWFKGFTVAAMLARTSGLLAFLTRGFMRLSAWYTLFLKRGRPKTSLRDVVYEWQRMFPSIDMNRIMSMDEHTARAEVRVQCPLRGTGDVLACYRVMEYDRAMLRRIGGQLVVLRSQAEPGVEVCQVAFRLQGEDISDLRAAHEDNYRD